MMLTSLSLMLTHSYTHPQVQHAYVPLEPLWFKVFVSS